MSSAYPAVQCISIHALLAESDFSFYWAFMVFANISIHALLAESDSRLRLIVSYALYFYPRSPCGERRFAIVNTPILQRNFYPRSPCGERHCYADNYIGTQKFLSTLSLRRATYMYMIKHINHTFLSTLSLRRATVEKIITFYPPVFLSTLSLRRATTMQIVIIVVDTVISIHALLAESDEPATSRNNKHNVFLSTLSLRRATGITHG